MNEIEKSKVKSQLQAANIMYLKCMKKLALSDLVDSMQDALNKVDKETFTKDEIMETVINAYNNYEV